MANKNPDIRARFAQRLRGVRIPRGYKTARSFARALGIDENRYTRYERAEVEPDLQLLMRICDLLDATPNDLLCDTIGMPPVQFEGSPGVPGFADRGHAPYATPPASAPPATGAVEEGHKAAAWELATLVDELESHAKGMSAVDEGFLKKLRRIAPLHARITADIYGFLETLPSRLEGAEIPAETEARIASLTTEIIAANKSPSNDNV